MIEVEICIYTLLEILSVVLCLHFLYGEKFHFDLLTIILIALEISWMQIIYWMELGNIWSLLMYPIVMLYCGLKFGFNFKVIFINNILYIAIISIIQATIMMVFGLVLGTQKIGAVENLIINFLTFLIIFLALSKCSLKKLSRVLQSHEKMIVISLTVLIINIFFLLLVYKKDQGFNILYYAVLWISVILIVIVVIDIGKHKLKAKEVEAELRLHKLYEESFRNLVDEISARQHEFDNHINTIYSQHFLYKTYEELVEAQKKYCIEVVKENRFNKLLTKGNPVVLCFLYSRFTEVEKEGVMISYRINVGDLKCKVPVYKMVELLGNLIKNAVEAAKERGGGGIHVMMLEEKDMIRIEVSNESEVIEYQRIQEFFRKGYSEKGKNRGYGLYNVKKICGEYGIEITCENREENEKNRLVFGLKIDKPL